MAAGRKRNLIRHVDPQSWVGDALFFSFFFFSFSYFFLNTIRYVFAVKYFAAAILILLHADEA